MIAATVEGFIDEAIAEVSRKPARLVLTWLRLRPEVLDTVKEVYAEGAKGNPEAFRAFAGVVWTDVNSEYGGVLEAWDVAPDDENGWIGMLALVVGAWGALEMKQ